MHASVDQPIDVPPQFGLINLAAAIEGNDVGSENATEAIGGAHSNFGRRGREGTIGTSGAHGHEDFQS
jgi:hypothetical protein